MTSYIFTQLLGLDRSEMVAGLYFISSSLATFCLDGEAVTPGSGAAPYSEDKKKGRLLLFCWFRDPVIAARCQDEDDQKSTKIPRM